MTASGNSSHCFRVCTLASVSTPGNKHENKFIQPEQYHAVRISENDLARFSQLEGLKISACGGPLRRLRRAAMLRANSRPCLSLSLSSARGALISKLEFRIPSTPKIRIPNSEIRSPPARSEFRNKDLGFPLQDPNSEFRN